ncbi:uncharacterized protein [Bactrocera oleae]|uniref:uncharacterized protein n=1 Tax=Bactrocera oleae TaxID=104688 RepID=UPI00387ED6A7
MKLLTVISLALCVVARAQQVSYVPNSPDPNNPGHCFHNELQLAIKLNETLKPANVDLCAELTCEREALIRVNHCTRTFRPSFCEDSQWHPTDFSKQYPDCCEHYECNK